MMVVSIIYEEKINMSKQPTQNTVGQLDNEYDEENKQNETDGEENPNEDENNDEEINTEPEEELDTEKGPTEDKDDKYIGEEESNTEDSTQSEEEKVLSLVKKEWGDDNSVTFNIENKSGSKYRVSVRSQATVIQWYEVDTSNWEVSEF